MIRINLLPQDKGRRSAKGAGKGGANALLVFAMLLAVVEVAALMMWKGDLEEQLSKATSQAQMAEQRQQKLQKAKRMLEEREQAKLELSKQNLIFERLKADKTGPSEMLQFISYVLTKKDDNLYTRSEINEQEAAGWLPNWNPDNLWLGQIEQKDSDVTLEGYARSHEDVAEFSRRLDTGPYLYCIDVKLLVRVKNEDFPDIELIKFEISAQFNPSQDATVKMARGDMPECLDALVEAHLAAQPKPAAGPKGDGAKDGKDGAQDDKKKGGKG